MQQKNGKKSPFNKGLKGVIVRKYSYELTDLARD